MDCANFINNNLLIKPVKNYNCPYKFKESYKLEEVSPEDMCILAFHAAYPYYLTLINGGWFSWVRPNDGLIVQCPNPQGALEMKVSLCGTNKAVRVEVIMARGHCPKGHKKGDIFTLNPKTFTFCPKAIDALIPYLKLTAQGEKLPFENETGKTVLKCPNKTCGNAEFTVEKSI